MQKLITTLLLTFMLQACATSSYSPIRISNNAPDYTGNYIIAPCKANYTNICKTTLFANSAGEQAALLDISFNFYMPVKNPQVGGFIYIAITAKDSVHNFTFTPNKTHIIKNNKVIILENSAPEAVCDTKPCQETSLVITPNKGAYLYYYLPNISELDGATLVLDGLYINDKPQPPFEINIDYRNFAKAALGLKLPTDNNQPVNIKKPFSITSIDEDISYGLTWATGAPEILPSDVNTKYINRATANGLSLGIIQGASINGISTAMFSESCFNGLNVNFSGQASDIRCTSSSGIYLSGFSSLGSLHGVSTGAVLVMDTHNGLQISAFNHANISNGAQISLIINSAGISNGVQIGAVNAAADTRKVEAWSHSMQAGLFNYNDKLAGVQMGIYNKAETLKGLQLGIINKANTLTGVQIGLLNIIKRQKIPMLPILNMQWK